MGLRQCPHCGKHVLDTLVRCPLCREALAPVPVTSRSYRERQGGVEIRKGLLWMLLAGVFHYFAAGYEPDFQLPFEVMPILTQYLLPLLFLSGLGLTLLGLYRRITS